jgi:hemolysin D
MKAIDRIRGVIQRALSYGGDAMVYRQSLAWSRGILWTIIGVASISVLWAFLAHMDEVVHAAGMLEPIGAVQDVQAPVGGVITEILVAEGQKVKEGDPLVRLDPKVAVVELQSLKDLLSSMKEEEKFYSMVLDGDGHEANLQDFRFPMVDLAKHRAALASENELLRAQIAFSADNVVLSDDQRRLFEESEKDRLEKHSQAGLKIQRSQKDLDAASEQLELSRRLLENSRKILEPYRRLVDTGGVSKIDFFAREADVLRAETQVQRVESLILALNVDIEKNREEAKNIDTTYRREAMDRLNENSKRIAEIESGLTKARLMNAQRMSEIESRLAQSASSLDYHAITSPADGFVFEIVATKPGSVLAPKDIVLKLVPSEILIAKVHITNRDIGFVKTGLACEVDVASFPYREYGRIPGKLEFIGSDALPPTPERPYYSFPAKISLERQTLEVRGHSVYLQSGMAVSANIKVRKRRVVNMFFDFLLGPIDQMREVR